MQEAMAIVRGTPKIVSVIVLGDSCFIKIHVCVRVGVRVSLHEPRFYFVIVYGMKEKG